MSISFATLNLENLQIAGLSVYGNTVTSSQYSDKVAWTSQLLSDVDADIIGFQEIWNNQALEAVFDTPDLSRRYQLRFGEKNRGIGCALAVRSGFQIQHSTSFETLPDEVTRLEDGDREIDVHLTDFSRPILRATILPPRQGQRQPRAISCFVAHLKSKRPSAVLGQPGVTLRSTDRSSLGSAISLIRRTVESAGLRVLVSSVMDQDINRPVVVLGDLNENQRAVPIDVLSTQPPFRLNFASGTGAISRWGLYAVAELQELRSLRDVYYTYVYQGLRETLDHILVSTHFYDHSNRRAWSFDHAKIWNDYIGGRAPNAASDHGLVRAEFDWTPANDNAWT